GEGQRGGEGTVNYSNEPNMQAAHLFNYAGRPWLSQYWVRRAQQQAYGAVDAVGGKTLELWLGPKPNTNWGVAVSPVNSSSSSQPMRPLEKREGGGDGSGNLR
ncbi:MAG: glycoside hydrolase family 92 protein, partial [Verrucomicrobia bacterium]|nr:glycoside hydrolase family 92 protein [Verrucomicrobiota bacterium]